MALFYIHKRSRPCSWKCKIRLVEAVLYFHVQEIILSKAVNHDHLFNMRPKQAEKTFKRLNFWDLITLRVPTDDDLKVVLGLRDL